MLWLTSKACCSAEESSSAETPDFALLSLGMGTTSDALVSTAAFDGLNEVADSPEAVLSLTSEARCVPEESPSAAPSDFALSLPLPGMGFSFCFFGDFCWLDFVHAMQPIGLVLPVPLAFLHFFTFFLENLVIGSVSPHTLQVICTGGPSSFGSCGFGVGQEYW